MTHVSWMKDLGNVLMDDTHIVFTRLQFESLGVYDSIGQPTSPSVGRAYRTRGGLVVEVEQDDRPGFVLRRGRVPLFVEASS